MSQYKESQFLSFSGSQYLLLIPVFLKSKILKTFAVAKRIEVIFVIIIVFKVKLVLVGAEFFFGRIGRHFTMCKQHRGIAFSGLRLFNGSQFYEKRPHIQEVVHI